MRHLGYAFLAAGSAAVAGATGDMMPGELTQPPWFWLATGAFAGALAVSLFGGRST